MNHESLGVIEECYVSYCSVIKPLIAQIEARSEKLPLQLFNEIRAFNDHIARCFYNSPSEEYIIQQTDKAQRHISRLALDSLKFGHKTITTRIWLTRIWQIASFLFFSSKLGKNHQNQEYTVFDNRPPC